MTFSLVTNHSFMIIDVIGDMKYNSPIVETLLFGPCLLGTGVENGFHRKIQCKKGWQGQEWE